jgi:hypothetical protein
MNSIWLVLFLCNVSDNGDYFCNRSALPAKDSKRCERWKMFYTKGPMTKIMTKMYEGKFPTKDQQGLKDAPVCVSDSDYRKIIRETESHIVVKGHR